MSYVDEIIEQVIAKNLNEPEFHQAVRESADVQYGCCHCHRCK